MRLVHDGECYLRYIRVPGRKPVYRSFGGPLASCAMIFPLYRVEL